MVDSLEEACAMLRTMVNVSVIELEYDGPRSEPAIALDTPPGRQITIRAAPGFQPEILFQPTAADPVSNPRTMIHISGGSVLLQDVAIAMDVPQEPVDGWALVRVEEAELLELSRCQLTIRNARNGRSAYAANVAFFEMTGLDRLQLMTVETEGARPPLALDLEDCIIRGEANLVRGSAAQPLRINWSNGLLATTGRLLTMQGATREPREGEHVQLELSHVTAVVDQGLFLATTEESHPFQLPLDVRATDCIFLTQPSEPFLAQEVVRTVDDPRELVEYDGRRNFYEGSELFWEIDAPSAQGDLQLDFLGWQDEWGPSEKQPAWGAVRWHALPEDDLPLHRHTPLDYALSDAPMIRGAEFDPRQSKAGFDARQLSSQPPAGEPSAEPATGTPMPRDDDPARETPPSRSERSAESA